MKPIKAHVTESIFRLVNFVPWIFPNWLAERAAYYAGDDIKDHDRIEDLVKIASLLEGDFSWKAVSVVVRIDHRELELIHKWMRHDAPPGRYDPERDSDSYLTKYASLGGHSSLGWIVFKTGKFYGHLMVTELKDTLCESCLVTFDKLPNGFTYLSLYFLLLTEATTRLQNIDLSDIKRYFYFQSFNPFSRRFRILAHYSRNQRIRQHVKENVNFILKDVRLAATHILNTWNIYKKFDELITVADFYRDSDTPYFRSSKKVENEQNEQVEDLKSSFVLITRDSNFYDAKLSSDPCENYCQFLNDEGICVDAIFIKSQLFKTFSDWHNFANNGLTISDSHLFLSLHLDCYRQFKKIADYANVALLHNLDIDAEVRYRILFDSLLMLDSLEEKILAVEKHIHFGCDDKYRARSEDIISHQQKIVQELRLSIEKRKNNSTAELQIENIKFHRRYSLIFSILVVTQIVLAALTVNWADIKKEFNLFKESAISVLESKFDNLIK